jgi:hypothetical protein
MADHKFQAGQRVTLAANIINRSARGGSCVVTKRLPERNGEFELSDQERLRNSRASGTRE